MRPENQVTSHRCYTIIPELEKHFIYIYIYFYFLNPREIINNNFTGNERERERERDSNARLLDKISRLNIASLLRQRS